MGTFPYIVGGLCLNPQAKQNIWTDLHMVFLALAFRPFIVPQVYHNICYCCLAIVAWLLCGSLSCMLGVQRLIRPYSLPLYVGLQSPASGTC